MLNLLDKRGWDLPGPFLVRKKGTGEVLATRVFRADTPWARMKGLLGRKTLSPEEGLWIVPANSVHTCFMRFPIDVVFLDAKGVILKVISPMPPWRMTLPVLGAKSVLELPAGASVLKAGDRLEFKERAWTGDD